MKNQSNYLPRPGDRVRIIGAMKDPYPLPLGTQGTVIQLMPHNWGTQMEVVWDNKSSLFLLNDDPYEIM